jgi:hypothetical protein
VIRSSIRPRLRELITSVHKARWAAPRRRPFPFIVTATRTPAPPWRRVLFSTEVWEIFSRKSHRWRKLPKATAWAGVDAALWMTTTAVAFLFIRSGRVQQHRQWMTRSFAVALVFLEVRVILGGTGWERLGIGATETVVWCAWLSPSSWATLRCKYRQLRVPAGCRSRRKLQRFDRRCARAWHGTDVPLQSWFRLSQNKRE